MTPNDLLTLQLRYAKAVYLAEQYRHESELLQQQLLQAARSAASAAVVTQPIETSGQEFTAANLAALAGHASLLTGLFTRTADVLGLSTSHVRQVALGRRTSDRTMAELLRQWQLLEQQGGAE